MEQRRRRNDKRSYIRNQEILLDSASNQQLRDTYSKEIEWLKTRRSPSSWKPTEEQIEQNCLACDQHLKGYIAGREVTEAQMWALQEAVTRSCSYEYGGPLSEMLEMLNRALGRKTAWEKCKPGATNDNAVAFIYPSPEAWNFAPAGTKFSEDVLSVCEDREPRISRCAVYDCYFLPTSMILPPRSVTDKLRTKPTPMPCNPANK